MIEELRSFKENIKDLSKRVYKWFKSPVFRVHILKIVAVALSLVLLASVYMVQVIYADEYAAFQALTTTANLNRDVSRGVMWDRNGIPLITNTSISVITYRHIPNTYAGEMREVAAELADLIELDYEDILTVGDKQDLFILLYPDYARDLVPAADRQGVSNADFHSMMIDRIETEHIERLTDDELRAHAIFIRMYQGAGTTTNIIKESPSEEEIARVTENLINLPGIDIGTDWVRDRPSEIGSHFVGSVSTHQQGIPRDRESYFLSQGYAANARVGTSQLERSLQSYLSGFQYRYFIDDGEETQLSQGLPGFNISLNLDTELQVIVEDIVANRIMNERRTQSYARYLNDAYAVVANPRTGEVLAMVGVVLSSEDGVLEATMNPLGTIHRASAIGSAVKGASLMAGYDAGITSIGHGRSDAALHIQASEPLRSWTNMGWVNDSTAIIRSSNVYFFRQSMELAGVHHVHNGPILNWPEDNNNIAWDIYRSFFQQLGLGSATGIELPHEGTGFTATNDFINLLFFSIGQADTYTTMQLAQYGAVLATRGDRMQMQLIQNIYMPGSDGDNQQLVRAFQPNLLNHVELTDAQWDTIQSAHRRVVTEGTAVDVFRGVNFRPAGKTGTAEDYLREPERGTIIFDEWGNYTELYNRTFVAYAPYDDPEIVVAVVVPQAQLAGTSAPNLAAIITREVMQAYFDLQADRGSGR